MEVKGRQLKKYRNRSEIELLTKEIEMRTIKRSEAYMNHLWDCGNRSIHDLDEDELNCLTGFLMMEKGYQHRHEYIIETDNLSELANDLTNVLIANDHNFNADHCNYMENLKLRTEELIKTICKNATDYARNEIEMLFETRIEEEASEKKWNQQEYKRTGTYA